MAAKKQNVEIIALACSDCKRRNYTTTKNRKTQTEKLELMKYCKWDRKHTLHKETKVNERLGLEIRAEFFNTFNHAQFGNPKGNIDSGSFGNVTAARSPRIGEVAMKLTF